MISSTTNHRGLEIGLQALGWILLVAALFSVSAAPAKASDLTDAEELVVAAELRAAVGKPVGGK